MYIHTDICTHYLNHLVLLYHCFSVAPYDVVIRGDNTYTQGQQLQLTCSLNGGPQLEYTWTFSGDVIPNQNTSTLTIENVTTTDGGDYTCNVTNDAGVDYDTITVYSELLVNFLYPLIYYILYSGQSHQKHFHSGETFNKKESMKVLEYMLDNSISTTTHLV